MVCDAAAVAFLVSVALMFFPYFLFVNALARRSGFSPWGVAFQRTTPFFCQKLLMRSQKKERQHKKQKRARRLAWEIVIMIDELQYPWNHQRSRASTHPKLAPLRRRQYAYD